jgi:hypothetical protein
VPGFSFSSPRHRIRRKKCRRHPRIRFELAPSFHRATAPLLALLATATARAADKITYDDHVLPLFQQSCLNCHNPDKAKGGLDLSTFSGAMKGGSGGKIAEAGDASSKLIAVVLHSAEPKMPPEGDKIAADQVEILKNWIAGGLLENKNSAARKPSKPKFDSALKSAADTRPEGPPPMPGHLLLEPPVLAPRASAVHALAASPWAPLLAVTGQRQVLLFDTRSLELLGILPFPEGDPISLAFTPNARYLIVGGGVPGKSGVTVTFDVVSGERMLVAAKEFDSVLAADLQPDLSRVATGSPSKRVKIWRAEDGSELHSIKKHSDWVTALDFSPDGILLASGDRNGGVWVWEADSGGEFHTLRAHQAAITATAFRADSNLLATASEDGSVRFWEMNGGGEVRKIDAHPGGVLAFAWSRDGSFITAGRDRVVRLWKPDFSLLREIKDQPDLPVAVAIDADGTRAFVADYRGRISAWDLATGAAAGDFDANPPTIAARLVALREEIHRHPETLAAAEAAARTTGQQLAAARQHLAEAEAAARQAGEARAAAAKARQQAEQQLATLGGQLAAKRDQASQARGRLDATLAEAAAKLTVLAAVDQKLVGAGQQQQTTAAELQRVEQALAQARAENRADVLAGLEAAVHAARPAHEAATRALDEARSEQGREQAALAAIEARRQTANAETAGLDAEVAAIAKQAESQPPARDAAARDEAEADARCKECEAAVSTARDAIAPTEKATADAEAELGHAKQRLDWLRGREKHWSAASLHTDALKAGSEADARQLEADQVLADFQSLAKDLEQQAAALASARQSGTARDQLASLEARLAATSVAFTGLKDRADLLLPAVHELHAHAAGLKARFLAQVAAP